MPVELASHAKHWLLFPRVLFGIMSLGPVLHRRHWHFMQQRTVTVICLTLLGCMLGSGQGYVLKVDGEESDITKGTLEMAPDGQHLILPEDGDEIEPPYAFAEMKPVSVEDFNAKLDDAKSYHELYRIFYGDDYTNEAIDRILTSSYPAARGYGQGRNMFGSPRIGGRPGERHGGNLEGRTYNLRMLDSPNSPECDQCDVVISGFATSPPPLVHRIRHQTPGRPPRIRKPTRNSRKNKKKHRKEDRRKGSGAQPNSRNEKKGQKKPNERKYQKRRKGRRRNRGRDRKHNGNYMPDMVIRWKTSNTTAAITRAISHNHEMSDQSSCKQPAPELVNIRAQAKDVNKVYFPECTVLYRCSGRTGCCNRSSVCAAKTTNRIQRSFVVGKYVKGNNDKLIYDDPEILTFINHTECECKPIESIKTCKTCVYPFKARRTNTTECECYCDEQHKTCERIRKGRKALEEGKLRCIKEKRCATPDCLYGPFDISSGYCSRPHESHEVDDLDESNSGNDSDPTAPDTSVVKSSVSRRALQ